jgi:hypothetical protein
MSIEKNLDGVGKVRTELEEEWPKINVQTIEVVWVHHSCCAKQTWIAIRTARTMPFGGAIGTRSLGDTEESP